MAKKPAKETSLPLVISLVFFVLTTIAFGVMWYMQYSDQQAKDADVDKYKKEKTLAAGEAADAALQARFYRLVIGIPEDKDMESVASETKGKAKITDMVKKFNEALAKAAGVEDASKLPDDFKIWSLDDKGTAMEPPAKGFLPVIRKANDERISAKEQSEKALTDYKTAVAAITDSRKTMEDIKKKFEEVAAALPNKFKKDLEDATKKFGERTKQYQDNEERGRNDLLKAEDEKQRAERNLNRLKIDLTDLNKKVTELTKEIIKKQDTFQYDEPQGKILRRLSDGVVEIDLGSGTLVRPGLTFSVLPSDYPERGRQSRMQMFRVPNDRGEYKSVERFVEKATIEVIEVLNTKLSRCRITSENEKIRDAVGPGDLLYNSAWRKGVADHIALVGIFDVNGDGTDDIESVARDLFKMGIPVDAYFDLKTRKWKGQIDTQTRFIIQGYSPITTGAGDSRRDEKSKLHAAIDDAIKTAQSKGGAQIVNFRDFFPRMGYRVKLDVSPEKINQAAAPYLQAVTTIEAPPAP
jgi:hypothetical protein